MSEKSIFSYSENMQLVIEQNEERDINYLRSFIRARRLSDTDAAILFAVALAGYSNRRNIERFLSLQTKYQVQPKKSYLYNINRLVDNGFLRIGHAPQNLNVDYSAFGGYNCRTPCFVLRKRLSRLLLFVLPGTRLRFRERLSDGLQLVKRHRFSRQNADVTKRNSKNYQSGNRSRES